MKKILIAVFTMASALMANDPLIDELSALNIIKESQIHILKVQDEGNLYLINGEPTRVPEGQSKKPFNFFITKDKKILIMGDAIHTDTKDKVGFPIDKSAIAGKEAFSYGTGKEILYVFTDPECPYCKEFEKVIPKLKDKYTFKIYLFPLPFHANAIPMSKWILKGKDGTQKGERLIAIANGSIEYKNLVLTPEEDKQLTQIINTLITVAQDAEIRGTPTVLDSDMKKLNWPTL
ncbi:MAG: thioredoxin fold domain-containing protein [Sulfuricurvum sp.]|uniref:thioredoxin fold domain-containing protein n=1 Tax=Sulfuricurvum sp. TaxID=2025608 RepID=UPI0026093C44|nr:thioredoxin fold domain-containing protein [Sulfuricurvum sp.]MDD5159477.1 thioredoxin fold domain-containing protein [Sulfuricurvum sp.]